jgi:hypothetical protein
MGLLFECKNVLVLVYCRVRRFRLLGGVSLMAKRASVLPAVLLVSLLASCGGGGAGSSVGTPPDIPALATIAPSTAAAGASAVTITLYGSNFDPNFAAVQWNGNALSSTWMSAMQMTATIPASDLASIGTAQVTVNNQNPGGGVSAAQTFTITAAPAATTWVRSVAGIATPQNIVWDATHGQLYVSIAQTDPVAPNTIVAINPVTGNAGKPVAAGNNPDLLTISSDSSYLWVGLDGANSVQRFLLPGLTKDISLSLPLNPYNIPPHAASLQAAPTSPHTVAVMIGSSGEPSPGGGVYIYDDATQRPTFIPGSWGTTGGPVIDSILWGGNDQTIYASGNGIATLNVTSSGVSLVSNSGGQIAPTVMGQYDASNGLLYDLNQAFNPANGSLVGTFDLPGLYLLACTADPSLGRYYVVDAIPDGGTDVFLFELRVFDLNTYALLDQVFLGATQGTEYSPVTGAMKSLVRWGNAGLALITTATPGPGGVFLIDGAAVNPNAVPDVSSGTSTPAYIWMTSLAPQQVPAGSGEVTVTINGTNFTPDSAVCSYCGYPQLSQFLPTSYVSPTQLTVSIPASALVNPGPRLISVLDTSSNLPSTNSLTFTVAPTSPGSTQVTALNVAGLAMAGDASTGLLYVGTADYDPAYPNSILAINGESGTVVQTQTVSPDPDLLSVSANGQYLYAAFAATTTMTQLQLPGLGSPLTWPLFNPESSAMFYAEDMKAAPVSPNTTALALFNPISDPSETGGVVIFDNNVERPNYAPFNPSYLYDTVAWGSSDDILTASQEPLSIFQVTPSGVGSITIGPGAFNNGDPMHSDFGTGMIYSDDGNVADPSTQAIVGTYNASGLVAPDSSLDRVFILGQTAAQANTSNFTIQSFEEKAYTLVSSITLDNLVGTPIELVRWGTSGLAVLTMNQAGGPLGMLYLVQDTTFVSNTETASRLSKPQDLVKLRWKRISKADILRMVQARRLASLP